MNCNRNLLNLFVRLEISLHLYITNAFKMIFFPIFNIQNNNRNVKLNNKISVLFLNSTICVSTSHANNILPFILWIGFNELKSFKSFFLSTKKRRRNERTNESLYVKLQLIIISMLYLHLIHVGE